MPERLGRLVARAIDFWAAFGGLSLLLLVALTGVGVFCRYVLNLPINGLRDLSQLLQLCCVSGAIPFAAKSGSHVVVDLLQITDHPKIRQLLVRVLAIVSAGLLLVLLIAMYRQASCGFRCGQFTPDLAIPFWPMYLVLGIGFALYLMQIVTQRVNPE